MTRGLPESRFYLWRAVVAMAHVDNFLAPDEQGKLYNIFQEKPFSDDQLRTIREDVASPQNVEEMFSKISVEQDRVDFFIFSRALMWCDNDLDQQEIEIYNYLKNKYTREEIEVELSESRSKNMVSEFKDLLDLAKSWMFDKKEKGHG